MSLAVLLYLSREKFMLCAIAGRWSGFNIRCGCEGRLSNFKTYQVV